MNTGENAQVFRSERPPLLRRVMRHRLVRFVGVLVMIGALARFTGCAERLFYLPSRATFVTPPGVEDVEFVTADGHRLHGWFFAGRDEQGAKIGRGQAVVHAHGNAGNVESHADMSSFLARRGIGVLVFDYRGYGRSDTGWLGREQLLNDTRAALAYVRTRGDVDPDRVGMYGVSLGGSFAAAVAAEDQRVRSLALVSAFSSWRSVASDHASLLGWGLIGAGVDAQESIKKLGARPLFLIHGEADGIVMPKHSRTLEEVARAAGVSVQAVFVPAAGHNDVLFFGEAPQDAVADFFVRTLR